MACVRLLLMRGLSTASASAHRLNLPALVEDLRRENREIREQLKLEKEELRREKQLLDRLLDLFERDKQSLVGERETLLRNTEISIASLRLDILRAKGLNNARGLFETLQFKIVQRLGLPCSLRGTARWESILKTDANFQKCIECSTRVKDISQQAGAVYAVYAVLSQHEDLKQLATQNGALLFDRGPLSPQMVSILACMGTSAGLRVEEDQESGTRLYSSQETHREDS